MEGAAVVVAAKAAAVEAAVEALEPRRAYLSPGPLEGGRLRQHMVSGAARRKRSLQASCSPDVYQEAVRGIKSMGRGKCLPLSLKAPGRS